MLLVEFYKVQSLIYLNDFPYSSSTLAIYLFADDSNIYCEAENLDLLQKIVYKEARKVKFWSDVDIFSLNIKKTSFRIFTSPKQSSFQKINIKIENLSTKKVMINFLDFSLIKIFLKN